MYRHYVFIVYLLFSVYLPPVLFCCISCDLFLWCTMWLPMAPVDTTLFRRVLMTSMNSHLNERFFHLAMHPPICACMFSRHSDCCHFPRRNGSSGKCQRQLPDFLVCGGYDVCHNIYTSFPMQQQHCFLNRTQTSSGEENDSLAGLAPSSCFVLLEHLVMVALKYTAVKNRAQ